MRSFSSHHSFNVQVLNSEVRITTVHLKYSVFLKIVFFLKKFNGLTIWSGEIFVDNNTSYTLGGEYWYGPCMLLSDGC